MEVKINSNEEHHEQVFFVESTVTTTCVHKVIASSFERAAELVKRGSIRSNDIVDTHDHREFEDVTEKYLRIQNDTKNIFGGEG